MWRGWTLVSFIAHTMRSAGAFGPIRVRAMSLASGPNLARSTVTRAEVVSDVREPSQSALESSAGSENQRAQVTTGEVIGKGGAGAHKAVRRRMRLGAHRQVNLPRPRLPASKVPVEEDVRLALSMRERRATQGCGGEGRTSGSRWRRGQDWRSDHWGSC